MSERDEKSSGAVNTRVSARVIFASTLRLLIQTTGLQSQFAVDDHCNVSFVGPVFSEEAPLIELAHLLTARLGSDVFDSVIVSSLRRKVTFETREQEVVSTKSVRWFSSDDPLFKLTSLGEHPIRSLNISRRTGTMVLDNRAYLHHWLRTLSDAEVMKHINDYAPYLSMLCYDLNRTVDAAIRARQEAYPFVWHMSYPEPWIVYAAASAGRRIRAEHRMLPIVDVYEMIPAEMHGNLRAMANTAQVIFASMKSGNRFIAPFLLLSTIRSPFSHDVFTSAEDVYLHTSRHGSASVAAFTRLRDPVVHKTRKRCFFCRSATRNAICDQCETARLCDECAENEGAEWHNKRCSDIANLRVLFS
jgi:hypothetical protein